MFDDPGTQELLLTHAFGSLITIFDSVNKVLQNDFAYYKKII
ncbi:hypothetical protein TRIP_B270006 [uncultured Desulfatiglans sp.]|nr:hypothetical protein TRIP_B270006 [uncultured Desulfatiglans sp.]